MSRIAAFAAVAALSLLSACAEVGPNYAVPGAAKANLPAARAPFVGATDAPVSQAAVPDDWWRLYDDPNLDALVRQALSANTDLRVAAANLARAEAVVSEARAAGDPTLSVSATAARDKESGEAFLLTQPLPAENLGDVGLRASYQIDLVGRLKRASEAARADSEATQAALDLAKVSVAADVVRAYVDACSAGAELSVAQRTVDLQSRTLAATSRLTAAGRGSAIDVTRGQALLDQSRAALPPFEARRRVALYRLAVLTGRPPAEFPAELSDCAQPPRLSRPIPVGDGAALLRRRPDVRQAERRLAGATARIGVATAALYPTVSLGLSVGSTGLLADIGQPAANHWSIGPLISWTLPTGGERARIRQANAGADAALARFDGVVLAALREVEASLTVYARDLDRNGDLRAAREQAAQAQGQAQRLYRAGRSPYLTGLDAQRTLATADAALAASDSQVADDQVALFLALGGGWATAVPMAPVPQRTAG
jgi:NodT family efflux transporter outer membrane factor (OMF) lipoprotein